MGGGSRVERTPDFGLVVTYPQGWKNADQIFLLVSVQKTMALIDAYPRKGGFFSASGAPDRAGLMRAMADANKGSVLSWAVHADSDLFARVVLEYEAGCPIETVEALLKALPVVDSQLGLLRTYLGRR